MADPRLIVVGGGPAGVRAAQTLVEAGLRPVLVDEAQAVGGQIYRRQPAGFTRAYPALYGADAPKAQALHDAFDAIRDRVAHRPETLAWNLRDRMLHVVRDGVAEALPFDALILATGATDRMVPIPGWTLPGSYSLGGAQIALKAQACSIGARVVFLGTGPLLYLVAYQYAKAGVDVAAVLDTAPFAAQVRATADLAARPGLLARGLFFRAQLRLRGVPVHNDVADPAVIGDGAVAGVRWRDARGRTRGIVADAVAMGYHLRPETQLADLAGVPIAFDAEVGQWLPERDAAGRTPVPGLYVAGDGARVLGADAAEAAGRLAALAALHDLGRPVDAAARDRLLAEMAVFERFRRGLATAFPWPADMARGVGDAVIVCRCEAITAGDLRRMGGAYDAPELNRAKALGRVGMGRCQGRYCGPAAAEILAQARGVPVEAVGRLRGQAPVKPVSLATARKGADA